MRHFMTVVHSKQYSGKISVSATSSSCRKVASAYRYFLPRATSPVYTYSTWSGYIEDNKDLQDVKYGDILEAYYFSYI